MPAQAEWIAALALAAFLVAIIIVHFWWTRRPKPPRNPRFEVVEFGGREWLVTEDEVDAETAAALERELRAAQTEQFR